MCGVDKMNIVGPFAFQIADCIDDLRSGAGFSYGEMTDLIILAENAVHTATGKENTAAAAGSGKNRLFAVLQRSTADKRFGRCVTAPGRTAPVGTAGIGAQVTVRDIHGFSFPCTVLYAHRYQKARGVLDLPLRREYNKRKTGNREVAGQEEKVLQAEIGKLMEQLRRAYTPYHASAQAAEELETMGYTRLEEREAYTIVRGGRYYVCRDGSALIAFSVGSRPGGFRIVASHLDSPCLKIKGNPLMTGSGCVRLNTEVYGGPLLYAFLNQPLRIAGRMVVREGERLVSRVYTDPHLYIIPSLAVHMQRDANTSLSVNPQTDLQPLVCLSADREGEHGDAAWEAAVSRDLYAVSAAAPVLAGTGEEFLVSPRLDNLTSVYASVEAMRAAGDRGICMIYLADSEEIGSLTRQGAGSDFLRRTAERIADALGEDIHRLLADSFLVSCDNAHAQHPSHPEKSDPTNPVLLGGGVVIKHHAKGNYTTDAFSDALFRTLMQDSGIPYQDFYMRADMPCGGTLGAVSIGQISVRSIDIGLAQLSMHAAIETMCAADYLHLTAALSAFFASPFVFESGDSVHL